MGSAEARWSKSGVRKLGSELRKRAAGELSASEFVETKEKVDEYRQFFIPLLNSLQERLHVIGEDMRFAVEITGWLKRM